MSETSKTQLALVLDALAERTVRDPHAGADKLAVEWKHLRLPPAERGLVPTAPLAAEAGSRADRLERLEDRKGLAMPASLRGFCVDWGYPHVRGSMTGPGCRADLQPPTPIGLQVQRPGGKASKRHPEGLARLDAAPAAAWVIPARKRDHAWLALDALVTGPGERLWVGRYGGGDHPSLLPIAGDFLDLVSAVGLGLSDLILMSGADDNDAREARLAALPEELKAVALGVLDRGRAAIEASGALEAEDVGDPENRDDPPDSSAPEIIVTVPAQIPGIEDDWSHPKWSEMPRFPFAFYQSSDKRHFDVLDELDEGLHYSEDDLSTGSKMGSAVYQALSSRLSIGGTFRWWPNYDRHQIIEICRGHGWNVRVLNRFNYLEPLSTLADGAEFALDRMESLADLLG